MKDSTFNELKRIAKRYKKYGVTLDDLKILFKQSPDEMTEEARCIGLRLALSHEFNEREYFTSADVATVTGETVEEVNKRIEENEDELLKNGSIVKLSSSLPNLFN